MAMRILLGSVRGSLHAAFVVMLSVSLVLLFLLWTILELFDRSQRNRAEG